jgi:hypothetical protein
MAGNGKGEWEAEVVEGRLMSGFGAVGGLRISMRKKCMI